MVADLTVIVYCLLVIVCHLLLYTREGRKYVAFRAILTFSGDGQAHKKRGLPLRPCILRYRQTPVLHERVKAHVILGREH